MKEAAVLLVDDIPEYLDTMEINLPDGCRALRATSAQGAQEIMTAQHVEAAVVDVRLRDDDSANRDGLVLLQWIRRERPHIGVIMISAYREFELEAEALTLGAHVFLKKPLQPDEFRNAVAEVLRAR